MADLSPYIDAADLPGFDSAWDVWTGADHDQLGCACDTCCSGPHFRRPDRLDTRIPAHRDFVARTLARVLGGWHGATAPDWRYTMAVSRRPSWYLGGRLFSADEVTARLYGGYHVPAFADIPLDHPDRDALALACVVRWLSTEIRAGRMPASKVTP